MKGGPKESTHWDANINQTFSYGTLRWILFYFWIFPLFVLCILKTIVCFVCLMLILCVLCHVQGIKKVWSLGLNINGHPRDSSTLRWTKNNMIGIQFSTIFNVINIFTMNMFTKFENFAWINSYPPFLIYFWILLNGENVIKVKIFTLRPTKWIPTILGF